MKFTNLIFYWFGVLLYSINVYTVTLHAWLHQHSATLKKTEN